MVTSRVGWSWSRATSAAAAVLLFASPLHAQSKAVKAIKVSDNPETPFKLATFEADGKLQIGLVFGSRVVDIVRANAYLVQKAHVPPMTLPTEMRMLIEQYETASKRLYQIANYLKGESGTSGLPFAYDIGRVSVKAPIKYPWNLLNLAANYRAHAEGMGAPSGGSTPTSSSAPTAGRAGASGFNAAAAADIDPDRDGPIVFAKSPRSCIIDPGEAYLIPPGRTRIDWEGELAIVMGKESYMIAKEKAHDAVFGYSILYDLSDRGGGKPRRVVSMFPGPNWFDGKSIDRGAPFGPVIVPKEFLPNFNNLLIVTRVNGVVKQDGRTSELIWDEGHMIQYITSIMSLYPGDLISTGTPAGTGAERNEFLKPGDVVEIEIEGIGTLRTPMDVGRGPAPVSK
ncbi:MAG TPA: fumarylacetoacetate hydrolase family protein [Bryobacteraceae bacterium]|nr:fumarylacetoacetate hydrolase family protein [Bryobacteraceae bacterium]